MSSISTSLSVDESILDEPAAGEEISTSASDWEFESSKANVGRMQELNSGYCISLLVFEL